MSKFELNIPDLQENVALAPYTTFKVGGPAKYFVVAKSKDELVNAVSEARKNNIEWFLLAGGSNILVSDDGYDGLVIKAELKQIDIDEDKGQARAEAGVRFSGLIARTFKHGLTGLEYGIGVPSTIGGAVWANLGARGSDINDFLIEVTILDEAGEVRVLSNEECEYSYRDSIFKHNKFVILDALFQLKKDDRQVIQDNIKELTEQRKIEQDVGAKTAGCTFRNPKDQTDVPAGKLIDDLDLKGKQIGGAKVSEKHANFIVNTGDATAEDIVTLISYIKQQVRDKSGVQLMEEIEYVGF